MVEKEVLYEAIARITSVYIKEISPESTFYGDLGADSIDMVQIFECVEKELDFKLDISEIDSIVTVGDALSLIENQVKKP